MYSSEAEVIALLDMDLELEDVTPFLTAAHMLVDAKCAPAGYTDLQLATIEAWLAAHLACTKDPQISKEKTGGSDTTYDGKTEMGLSGTRYGQQVKLLDFKKVLAELENSKGFVEIEVLF